MRKLLILLFIFINFISFVQGQKTIVIKSPYEFPVDDSRLKIFLGGTIDMGNSEDWQTKLAQDLSDENVILLNPRSDIWDKSWQPVSTDSNFRRQVQWELSALEASDIIVMYFAPGSQSPISLLEFGLYARTQKLRVVCPDGFWRKGNVDIVAEKYGIKVYQTLAELTETLKNSE
jgi:hypothetical protein